MLSLTLASLALLALVIGSTPLLMLATAGLAMKFYPLTAIVVIAAITVWAIHQSWR